MAKPCTLHLIPQAEQFFKCQTANVGGGEGGLPSSFSGGFKGGILFEKRIPLCPCSAQRCNPPSPWGWYNSNQILLRIGIKQMHKTGIKAELHRRVARIGAGINVGGGDDCDDIVSARV